MPLKKLLAVVQKKMQEHGADPFSKVVPELISCWSTQRLFQKLL